jgi:hypothetical protein
MSTALEIATASFERIEEKKRREAHDREIAEVATEATRLRIVEETRKEAIRTLGRPEWFPGVYWNLVDDKPGSNGTALGFDTTGQNIVLRDQHGQVTLHFWRCTDGSGPSEVRLVSLQRDDDTGYNYWAGGLVKSAADVGQALAAGARR